MPPKTRPSIRAEIRRQQLAAQASWDPPVSELDLLARIEDLEQRVKKTEDWKRWFESLAKREVQDRRRIKELEGVTFELMNHPGRYDAVVEFKTRH